MWRWSTESVARQTLDRAAEIGLAVHVLSSWYDVDDVAALRRLRSELYAGVSLTPHLRRIERRMRGNSSTYSFAKRILRSAWQETLA